MTPPASSPAVRARMTSQRTTGTGPELALRRAVRALGVTGYRVGRSLRPDAGRPVRPDLSHQGRRLAVFVDGCWWHGCPDHSRHDGANGSWWAAKLAANRARDASQSARLRAAGWTVVRVWEHDDPGAAALVVAALLRPGT